MNRKRLLAFAFKIDDIIILDSKIIETTRLKKFLNYKNLDYIELLELLII